MYRREIIRNLDFVRETAHGLDYWSDVTPAEWAAGNAIGRDRAAQVIHFMRKMGDPVLGFRVSTDIVRKPVSPSILAGWCFGISTALITGR